MNITITRKDWGRVQAGELGAPRSYLGDGETLTLAPHLPSSPRRPECAAETSARRDSGRSLQPATPSPRRRSSVGRAAAWRWLRIRRRYAGFCSSTVVPAVAAGSASGNGDGRRVVKDRESGRGGLARTAHDPDLSTTRPSEDRAKPSVPSLRDPKRRARNV